LQFASHQASVTAGAMALHCSFPPGVGAGGGGAGVGDGGCGVGHCGAGVGDAGLGVGEAGVGVGGGGGVGGVGPTAPARTFCFAARRVLVRRQSAAVQV
jgi:hypothetical protein